ncbi:MAG: zinc ribbon domain-containing protein [Chloroflexi bacterium]|nr:zinc ribbon domain-containing protein [Chloroflexota bacterium]
MTLDQNTINNILLFFITFTGAVASAIRLGLILWTYRDARLRSRDSLAQITAATMVAVLGIFGVIIYVMLRPQETLAEAYERSLEEEALLQNIEEKPVCPGCGRPAQADWQVCPYCHTKLKKPCINCEKMLELAWNLCPYCATSQVEHADHAPAPAQAARRRSVASQLGESPPAPPGFESDDTVQFIDEGGY